jgi:hypothetical protein
MKYLELSHRDKTKNELALWRNRRKEFLFLWLALDKLGLICCRLLSIEIEIFRKGNTETLKTRPNNRRDTSL